MTRTNAPSDFSSLVASNLPSKETVKEQLAACEKAIDEAKATVKKARADRKLWRQTLKFIEAASGNAPKRKPNKPRKSKTQEVDALTNNGQTAGDTSPRNAVLAKIKALSLDLIKDGRAELIDQKNKGEMHDDDELWLECANEVLAERLEIPVDKLDETLAKDAVAAK